MNYVTNAKAMKMMEEIVAEHAPEILARLGFNANDEILNKISILTDDNKDTPRGCCSVQIERDSFKIGSERYLKGTANISLYPIVFFTYKKKNGNQGKVPFIARFLSKKIYRLMVHTVAHELRHYWQYDSGEYFRNETLFFGQSIMPYEWRWCERDANEFAREYIKSINL